jgi:lysozyme
MNDNLKTSQNGLEFIMKWEGVVLKPYKDVAGLRTIGVGHLIKSGEVFPDGIAITKERALEILSSDVVVCESGIKKNIKIALNQNQFDALVSFGFNCGVGVYSRSGVATAVNSGDFDNVPDRLAEWSRAIVNGSMLTVKGLLDRRGAEGALFMTPSDGSLITEFPVPWSRDTLIEAQTILQKMGLYVKTIDGLWGPGTAGAIASFAGSKGISLSNPQKGVPMSFMNELRKQVV